MANETDILLVDTTLRLADGLQVTLVLNGITKTATMAAHQAQVQYTEAELAGLGGDLIGQATFEDEDGNAVQIQAESTRQSTVIELTGIAVDQITSTGARVQWQSSQAAAGRVRYGKSQANPDGVTADTAQATAHTRTIGGLDAQSIYYYRPEVTAADGSISRGESQFFTTLAAGTGTDNLIPTITPADGAELTGSVTFQWTQPTDLGWVWITIGTGKTPHPDGGGRFEITGRLSQSPGQVDASFGSVSVQGLPDGLLEVEYAYVAKGGTGPNGEDWSRITRDYIQITIATS